MKRVPGSRAAPSPGRPAWRPLLSHKPAESCGVGSAGILLRTRLRASPTAGRPASVRPACPRGAPPTSVPAPLASARSPRSGLGGRGAPGSGAGREGGRAAPSGPLTPRSPLARAQARPAAPARPPPSREPSPSLAPGGGAAGSSSSRRSGGDDGAAGTAFLSGGAAGRRGRLLPQAVGPERRGGLSLRPRGRSGGAALPSGRRRADRPPGLATPRRRGLAGPVQSGIHGFSRRGSPAPPPPAVLL